MEQFYALLGSDKYGLLTVNSSGSIRVSDGDSHAWIEPRREHNPVCFVVFEYDPDPDFSWLEQDCFADIDYRDPSNHVALETLAYDEDGEMVDSLGNSDFLRHEDNWGTGTFYRLSAIPEAWTHQREIARNMGLPE